MKNDKISILTVAAINIEIMMRAWPRYLTLIVDILPQFIKLYVNII